MVGGIYWCHRSLLILFFVIVMLGLYEFYGLLLKSGNEPQRILGMVTGGIIFGLVNFTTSLDYRLHFSISIILLSTIFFAELYRNKEKPFQNIAYTLMGIVYVVLPFAMWANFLNQPTVLASGYEQEGYNPHLLLGLFFLLWTNDTGA